MPDPLIDRSGFNYAIVVQYNGTDLAGFQIQNNAPTVQQFLEESIRIVLREPVRVHCAGRTDSGVHATGQVGSFLITKQIEDLARFQHSVNALLPHNVSILRTIRVGNDFHPRFSCIAREYEYLFWTGEKSPWWKGRAWEKKIQFDLTSLNKELNEILGERDFTSLTREEYVGKGTVRYLDFAQMRMESDPFTGDSGLVILKVRANAFLHNMIRILAGTIADRARGKTKSISDIISEKKRDAAGQTAPPMGLYFRNAFYLNPPNGLAHLELDSSHSLLQIHAGRARRLRENGTLAGDAQIDLNVADD